MTSITDFFPHESYYPYQKEVLEIIEQNYDASKHFLLEIPPGVGKTAIADAISEFSMESDVLTNQIRLQEQYYPYGFKTVRGRGNFNCLNSSSRCNAAPCVIEDEYHCQYKPTPLGNYDDERYSAGVSNTRGEIFWKTESPHCEYWQQKMDALNSVKRIHNYMYYIYETNYAGDFGSPKTLICDECHEIEGLLMDFVKVEITRSHLEKVGVLLQNFTNAEDWMTWLNALQKNYIPRRLSEIEIELTEQFKNYKLVTEKKNLDSLLNKIKFFLIHYEKNPGGWMILPHIYHGKIEKVEFKPLFVHEFAAPLLFKNSEKVILMSGTILDFNVYARSIGLDINKCVTVRVPSPFPVENRLIYKANIGFLDSKGTNPRNDENLLDNIIHAIDTTLSSDQFTDVKGIIHTTTYQLARYITEHSAHAPRMLTHTDSFGATQALKKHADTPEPTVLVSPSMYQGVDLKDNLSRIQICIKVPYPNTMDPVINARRNIDPLWYYCKAGIQLFQSMARSTRSPTDYSTTIMFDSRFSYFVNKQINNQAPSWIEDATRSQKDLENDLGLYLKLD
ncbi:MAG: hypothetical protein KAS04_01565 [Candidatus Aenigmarchaeota archaeon]|nr:hypothetical protein [Candidatus Aenigmarchaeota archaeon]